MAQYAAVAPLMLAQVRQGQAMEVQAKGQAEVVRSQAKDREVARRRRLVESLASQNAMSAAGNVASFEGSTENIMREDMRLARLDTVIDRAGASRDSNLLLSNGRYARRSGYLNAASSLIGAGYDRHKETGSIF